MTEEIKPEKIQTQLTTDALKGWVMVALTLIFVFLYVGALLGLINPLKDVSIINRLEPIIFVIIGYYFGRLPAQANERTLKDEINRQSQKTDAARQIKEKAQQEREVLEEKIRNAKITLAPQIADSVSEKSRSVTGSSERQENTNQAVEAALKILDS